MTYVVHALEKMKAHLLSVVFARTLCILSAIMDPNTDKFICEGCTCKEAGKNVKCQKCKKSEGILKCIEVEKRKFKKWVHLSCVIWSNHFTFSKDMTLINGEWKNHEYKHKYGKCSICNSDDGSKLKVC